MVNWDFPRGGPRSMHQNGQETMQSVEREYAIEGSPFENSEPATRIEEINAQDAASRHSSDTRRRTPNQSVAPAYADTANKVIFFQFGQQRGQISGIILKVSVQRSYDRA